MDGLLPLSSLIPPHGKQHSLHPLNIMFIELLLVLSLAFTYCTAAPLKTAGKPLRLQFDVRNTNEEIVSHLMTKRDTILEVNTDIHQVLLTFAFTLAGQSVTAVVDTGSFSTWLISKSATQEQAVALCASQSCIDVNNEIKVLDDDYHINYMGDFGASGKWALAPISINGVQSAEIKFGLADTVRGSPSGYAWSGFGYSSYFESRNSQMLDVLKNGGVIDQRVVALVYDDFTSWSNKILGHGVLYLGGYDGEKELTYIEFSSRISSSIQMANVINNEGEKMEVGYNKEILFDSGSTSLLLKSEYKNFLFGHIEFDTQYPTFFKCSKYANEVVKFELGGKVLEIPLLNMTWNNYKDTYDLCQLMVSDLESSESYELIFGQYILKNLVTVIDVDNGNIGLAVNAEGVTFD